MTMKSHFAKWVPTCNATGKIMHLNRKTAHRHAKHLRKTGRAPNGKAVAYRCPACGAFHVSSGFGAFKKKRRNKS